MEFYQKNPEAISRLQAPIFEDKVVDFIVALAKVTERAVTPGDFQAEISEPEPAARQSATKKKAGGKPAAKKKTTSKSKGEAKTAAESS